MNHWDKKVDLLVVGSGNGALTAALSAYEHGVKNILIVEKSHYFGGTSALSGGGVWVPCNRYAKQAGAKDSLEEAFTYLDQTIPKEKVPRQMLKRYLAKAPEMIDFLHEKTRVRYQSLSKYPDYYTNLPGAKEGHRSMEPEPLNAGKLGEDFKKLRPDGVMYMLEKFAITQVQAQILMAQEKGWKLEVLKLLLSHYKNPFWIKKHGVSKRITGGGAGVGRLYLSIKDRSIKLQLNTTFNQLLTEDSKVIGAQVNINGKTENIKTNNVVLAAGGFEHNQTMREKYLPAPTNTHWSAGCRENQGDGIIAGKKVGAKTHLMNSAWWCTTLCIPDREYPFLSIVTKSLPGSITVNRSGKRFSNESQNYMAFQEEAFEKHSADNPNFPSFMIFDESFRNKHKVFPLLGPIKLLPEKYFTNGFSAMANTLEELAEKMDINPSELKKTVEQFNQYAEAGKDPDFNRGDSAYDRYYGDSKNKPNPCLGKITTPPFFAMRMDAGDFGTQGGLVINENAQVMNKFDEPIKGLYACGNCTAAVLPTYPGPGSTLGPAMTFGYLAGKHIAKKITNK